MERNPMILSQTTGTNGDTNFPPLNMDAVDFAFIDVPGYISFERARLYSGAPNASYRDSWLNPVTVSGGTKSAVTGANGINGLPAINNPGTGTQLGSGPSYQINVQMPPSFTFLALVKPGALKFANHLFSTSASDFQWFINANGTMGIDTDGTGSGDSTHTTTTTLAANTPVLVAISFDAATKTTRLMKGGPVAIESFVSPVVYPATDGAKPQPLSYFNGGTAYDFNGAWAVRALFDRAYGAGGTAEADFAIAWQAATAMYGLG